MVAKQPVDFLISTDGGMLSLILQRVEREREMNVKLDAYHLLELYVTKLATLSEATSKSSSSSGSGKTSSGELSRVFNGASRVTSGFYSRKTSPGSDHEAAVLRITQALVKQVLNTKNSHGRNADANKLGALALLKAIAKNLPSQLVPLL